MLFRLVLIALLSVFHAAGATASELRAPTGDVILTVSGDISVTNNGNQADFDIEMLKEIEVESFETSTIWTEGIQSFEGVSLAAFLDFLGIEAGTLSMTAINDYEVIVPTSDAEDGGPILAYMRNGTEMSVRDKGPVWLVYPYDHDVKYQTKVIYTRSIWQLDRIVVKK